MAAGTDPYRGLFWLGHRVTAAGHHAQLAGDLHPVGLGSKKMLGGFYVPKGPTLTTGRKGHSHRTEKCLRPLPESWPLPDARRSAPSNGTSRTLRRASADTKVAAHGDEHLGGVAHAGCTRWLGFRRAGSSTWAAITTFVSEPVQKAPHFARRYRGIQECAGACATRGRRASRRLCGLPGA